MRRDCLIPWMDVPQQGTQAMIPTLFATPLAQPVEAEVRQVEVVIEVEVKPIVMLFLVGLR